VWPQHQYRLCACMQRHYATKRGAGWNEGVRVCRHRVVGEVDMMIWMVWWELGWGAHFLGRSVIKKGRATNLGPAGDSPTEKTGTGMTKGGE
jgi:hypothetical protein